MVNFEAFCGIPFPIMGCRGAYFIAFEVKGMDINIRPLSDQEKQAILKCSMEKKPLHDVTLQMDKFQETFHEKLRQIHEIEMLEISACKHVKLAIDDRSKPPDKFEVFAGRYCDLHKMLASPSLCQDCPHRGYKPEFDLLSE